MKRILTLFYFGFILALPIVFYSKPDYNWDILPYMGLSLNINPRDVNAVHILPYAIAEGELPPNKFAALIDSTIAYRKITATDPVVFQHELGFYRTRPLYIWMIQLCHAAGIHYTKATVLPSVLAYLLIGMLLYFWIVETHRPGRLSETHPPGPPRETHPLYPPLLKGREGEITNSLISLLFCLLIMVSPFMVNTARLSTPDMLAALFLLSGSWLLLEKRSVIPVSVLFLLAILTRYDCILFILIILAWLSIIKKKKILRWWPLVAGMIVITVLQCREILFIVKHVLFIVPSSDRLVGLPEGNIFTGYISSLINGFPSLFHSQVALISFIFLVDIILKRKVLHIPWNDPALLFSLFVYAYIPVRYIVHPAIDDRFLVGNYILLMVFFLRSFKNILNPKIQNSD